MYDLTGLYVDVLCLLGENEAGPGGRDLCLCAGGWLVGCKLEMQSCLFMLVTLV